MFKPQCVSRTIAVSSGGMRSYLSLQKAGFMPKVGVRFLSDDSKFNIGDQLKFKRFHNLDQQTRIEKFPKDWKRSKSTDSSESFADRITPAVMRKALGLEKKDFAALQTEVDLSGDCIEVFKGLLKKRIYPFNLVMLHGRACNYEGVVWDRMMYKLFKTRELRQIIHDLEFDPEAYGKYFYNSSPDAINPQQWATYIMEWVKSYSISCVVISTST